MTLKQLSIFIENKAGRLFQVLNTLGEEEIRIKALTVADTSEYGILRLLVSDPDKAESLLKDKGFSVNITEVISIATPNEAGSFAGALKLLYNAGISIEYMYAFSIGGKEAIVFKTDNKEKAIQVFEHNSMEIIRAHALFNL